jgi:APA family basic amino acid/polyamine antiporter
MVPVLFAYGGWQTSCFVAEELREPERNLPRALLGGMAGVIAVYVGVNVICLLVLGAGGLATIGTPAAAVMQRALGPMGARAISVGVAISTLGYLSQTTLTAPRVYFAMAADRLFFRKVAEIHPRTHVPVTAIVLQGAMAIVITLLGKYEDILNATVPVDMVFYGITALALFVLRLHDGNRRVRFRVPGHPFTTLFFAVACWAVAVNEIWKEPRLTGLGFVTVLAGLPVYYYWRRRGRR